MNNLKSIISQKKLSAIMVLFAFLLISQVPMASAQFVLSGSSGGGDDAKVIPPTLDDSVIFSDGTDDLTIDISQNVQTNIVSTVGTPITFTFTLTDDYGADDIVNVKFLTDYGDKPDDMNQFYANNFNIHNEISRAFYEWNANTDDVPFVYSENATFDEVSASTANNVLTISYTMTWNSVMGQSEIALKSADTQFNFLNESLPITLEITENIESATISTTVLPDPVIPSEPEIPSEIIPESVAPEESTSIQVDFSNSLKLSDSDHVLSYDLSGANLNNILPQPESNSLLLLIDSMDDGSLSIALPRDVIDAKSANGLDDSFFILVDGEEALFEETISETERIISVNFPAGTEKVEIIGTFVIPEFGTIAIMILVVSIVSLIVFSSKSALINRI